MTVAPVRLAMAMASPRWSPWPCETRMKSAGTASAFTTVFGLPVRNGSMRRCRPSLSSSRAECPSQRSRVAMRWPPGGSPSRVLFVAHLAGSGAHLLGAQNDRCLIQIERLRDVRLQFGPQVAIGREQEIVSAAGQHAVEPLPPLGVGMGQVKAVFENVAWVIEAAGIGMDQRLARQAPDQV